MNRLRNADAHSGRQTLSLQLFAQLGVVEQKLALGDDETTSRSGGKPEERDDA